MKRDLRLDYVGTKYTGEGLNKGYFKLEFESPGSSGLDYPFANAGDKFPNTKAGVLGGDSRILMEYKAKGNIQYKDGQIAKYYNSDGVFQFEMKFKIDEETQIGKWEK